EGVSGLCLVKSSEIADAYPVSDYYNPHGDRLGHISFTPDFFTSLGSLIARKIYALKTAPHKVIVVDCDQTLWKGVCGEDGPLGIAIDPPRRALQEILVAQHDAGMLICVCSKNNKLDVAQAFEQHPEMPLGRNHVVSWRVNWKPKSENIRSLAEELGLGLDSFILIDDSPIECAEVRANCPDVLVLQLPQEADAIPKFLQHVWALDHVKVTAEDKTRTVLYKQNLERERFSRESAGLENFLAGLELKVTIREMGLHDLGRVSQLTQRTNQFNCTTLKRSESELRKLSQSGELECLVVEVRDRFGDYGLVGVMTLRAGPRAIAVDTFLLSCRALGRGVEHQMLARAARMARDRGLERVDIPLFVSGKNQPAIDFLSGVAAEFRQPLENGHLFQCPAEWGATLAYRPGKNEPAARPASEAPAASPPIAEPSSPFETRARTSLLLHIAEELRDVEQIRGAIDALRQRPRPDLES
ncbi:MAG: HAD-IIIC family phosphatase, partial [Candidatus Binatia bacterium]